MSLLSQLRERSSAKAFDGRTLPNEILEQILEATSYSPRAGNFQHFSIRVITGEEDIKRASQIFFDCELTAGASALLVFFVDQNSTAQFFASENVEYPFANLAGYHYALADAVIAMQTAALTAEGLGLASRFLAASLRRSKAVAQASAAPEGVLPIFTLVLGYEAEKSSPRRHNLPWQSYTAHGFQAPWPDWKGIYRDSGKAEADLSALLAMENVAANVERDSSLNTAARIWSLLRYKVRDLRHMSQDLSEMLQKLFK